MAEELFRVEDFRPIELIRPVKLNEDNLPIAVFFNHAILIDKHPDQDVLRNLCREKRCRIYYTEAEKPYLRSKRILPELRAAVFACSNADWPIIRNLAENIDYFCKDQFYKPIWFCIETQKMPMPLPVHPHIWILGLAAADRIIQPVREGKNIVFEEITTRDLSDQQGEAAKLNSYEMEIRKIISKWN